MLALILNILRVQVCLLVILFVAPLFLSGCATPFNFPNAPKNIPKPQYNKIERKVIRPEIVTLTDSSGKTTTAQVGYSETYQYDISATPSIQSKPGFLSWILTRWWIWLLVLAAIFVPGFGSILLFGLNRFRKGAGQMVKGVEEFLKSDAPQDMKDKLLNSLRSSSDESTKKMVSELKRK